MVGTNGLVNVSFQPVKSILLITSNYFFSTESRNLERLNDEVKPMQAFVLRDQYTLKLLARKRKVFGFTEY